MKYIRNSVIPQQRVTHRAMLNIPDIVSAPRSSTFVPCSYEEACKVTDAHADAFCKALEDGSYKTFSYPMFGVYGERL